MNKKVMAIAVAGVLAAPAVYAQTSNVQIYGRANLGVDSWEAKGATVAPGAAAVDMKRRTRVFDSGSRVGLRGTEDLGNGLKAIFQIETGVNIDNGSNTGQAGTQNLSSGFWASRDSFAGLDTNFGRITFGRQSIYWANGIFFQVGANYMETDLGFITGGLGRVGVGVSRASNVVQYTTPTFGGFNATFSYSPDSNGGGTTSPIGTQCSSTTGFVNSECVAANREANARILGATARWTGPAGVSAQLDYVTKQSTSDNEAAAGTGRLKNQGLKLLVGWSYMPGAIVSVQLQQAKNENVAAVAGFSAVGDDVKARSWALHWEHTFGNIQPYAEYGQVTKAKGCTESVGAVAGVSGSTCTGTEARAFGAGARYLLSKRTWIYAQYNDTRNKENATVDNTGSSITSGITAGMDPKIWTLGFFHNF